MSLLGLGEFHEFGAADQRFLYLVPSAAVFALDDPASALIDTLGVQRLNREDLLAAVSPRFPGNGLDETLAELELVRAVRPVATPAPETPTIIPLTPFPLTTAVLNVTNQCNLSCAYCYEYSEDKIVDTTTGAQPKFMSEETARQSIDLLFREAGDNAVVHVSFFGGETLLNFPVLSRVVPYAREEAAARGKRVEFNLTTNATLLSSEMIDFLVEHDIAVTVSIDGPREMQDRFRVFRDGAGSYDALLPRVRELLRRHHSRPIGARVTLTSQVNDISGIFHHLTEEIGFQEVGFAPVTTSPGRDHALDREGFDKMVAQFKALADEFLDAAAADRHHGFSNVSETLAEIHKGVSKAYPCGAGLGLMGVSTGGDVALCHRFAGSEEHRLGSVDTGIDREAQTAFLERHHLAHKIDCHTCWARPLCSGGCYHEAHTRYGTSTHANLHYCDWIREWTDICLRIYGELAERNGPFLNRFDS
ncbi:MAG: quinohemoprotein amine dehydrogenase maturation protein [Acidobacteria bacterium]|jgi:uncharacterized protein|nr:quinohemoprotein amine dehydrogenase maturation protein [Acidobacteriota bacterium]MDP7339157.1 quinohemoprotein amine dehydrogenase maturation protein [Vicinamibacterales bacterium]HJN46977.1 quinohemoprotein amine dehydrogenase maturation protein [Vicinamibacterales bacterium]|tara:strand:+ start:705 stop:2132 length:1428 start_codon:yes stop_codon:yes gene_type:complete